MSWGRALPVFSAVFAVIYLACMYFNIALFSYFPRLHEWFWLTVTNPGPKSGPGMYWYGWIANAVIGASVIATLSLLVPARVSDRAASLSSWAAPSAVILVLLFILRGWFTH